MSNNVLSYAELLDDLRARVEKGKTQRDICADAGIDETHFSGIINGKKIASRRVLALLGYETVYRRRPDPETPK